MFPGKKNVQSKSLDRDQSDSDYSSSQDSSSIFEYNGSNLLSMKDPKSQSMLIAKKNNFYKASVTSSNRNDSRTGDTYRMTPCQDNHSSASKFGSNQFAFNENIFTPSTIMESNMDSAQQLSKQEISELFDYITYGSVLLLNDFLHEHPQLDLMRVADEVSGFYTIHQAVYKNSIECTEALINNIINKTTYSLNDQHVRRSLVRDFVNLKATKSELFTPLHLASFNGYPRMINLLVTYGANINSLSKSGYGMLHLAAQGDQPFSIAYFKQLGVNVNQADHQMMTPMHWAFVQDSYSAFQYLAAYGADINKQDRLGMTPLHHAVRSTRRSQNDYLITKLIIKGAKLDLEDKQGRLPYDMVSQNSTDKISDDKFQNSLLEILDPNSRKCMNLLTMRQPLQKLEPSRKYFYAYIMLLTLTFVIFQFIILPNLDSDNGSFCINLFYGLSFLFFLLTSYISPGHITRTDNLAFTTLLSKFEARCLCPYCEVVVSTESKHCYICQKCVLDFDHHCTWVNNCIGRKNHAVFILFLLTSLGLLITSIIVTLSAFGYQPEYLPGFIDNTDYDWEYTKHSRNNNDDQYFDDIYVADVLYKILCVMNLIPSFIFILPVSYLLTQQVSHYWTKRFAQPQTKVMKDQSSKCVTQQLYSPMKDDEESGNRQNYSISQINRSTTYAKNTMKNK